MRDIHARRLLSHKATAFGFREGLRERPFIYDFSLPGLDGCEVEINYETGRELGLEARLRGVDPGFYPEGKPSAALVTLLLDIVEFREGAETDNDVGILEARS